MIAPSFLLSLRRGLPLGYHARTFLGGGYLRHRLVLCTSQNRVGALLARRGRRGWEGRSFSGALHTCVDAPNPDSAMATGWMGASLPRSGSALASSRVGAGPVPAGARTHRSLRNSLVRPHAGRATVSAVVLYDHRDNFLQLKTFAQPVSRARVRVSLLNDPQSLLDGWRRQAFRWHVLGPDLETAPGTPSDETSRHHVLCGLPESKARYFEHWAAQAGLNVELEAVVPYALAAFCWLRDAVRARVAAGAPGPAFFGLVAGHDHAWLGYWDGQKYAFLADQDRERLHAVGEVLEEIRAEFSGRARAGEPADHPPVYLVARTEAELTALREALCLEPHVPVAGLGSPVFSPAAAADPRERESRSGDGPAPSWPGLSLGPEPEAELLGHVLNLL